MLKPTGIFGQKKLSSDPGTAGVAACCRNWPAIMGVTLSGAGDNSYNGVYTYTDDPDSVVPGTTAYWGTDLTRFLTNGTRVLVIEFSDDPVSDSYMWSVYDTVGDVGYSGDVTPYGQFPASLSTVNGETAPGPTVSDIILEGMGAGGCCAPYDADKKMHTGDVPGVFKPSQAYSS